MSDHNPTHPTQTAMFDTTEIARAVSYGMSEISGGLPTSGAILAALSITILPKGSHLWLVDEGIKGVTVVALRQTVFDVNQAEVLTERGAWMRLSDTTNLRVGA